MYEDPESPSNAGHESSQRLVRVSLWSFIYDLLEKEGPVTTVAWTNRDELEFKIVNADGLAREWGQLKGRSNMTYSKFARAMRYYYGKDVIEKVAGKRFTYRFINSAKTSCILPQKKQYNKDYRRESEKMMEELIKSLNMGKSETMETNGKRIESVPTTLSCYTNYSCSSVAQGTVSLPIQFPATNNSDNNSNDNHHNNNNNKMMFYNSQCTVDDDSQMPNYFVSTTTNSCGGQYPNLNYFNNFSVSPKLSHYGDCFTPPAIDASPTLTCLDVPNYARHRFQDDLSSASSFDNNSICSNDSNISQQSSLKSDGSFDPAEPSGRSDALAENNISNSFQDFSTIFDENFALTCLDVPNYARHRFQDDLSSACSFDNNSICSNDSNISQQSSLKSDGSFDPAEPSGRSDALAENNISNSFQDFSTIFDENLALYF